MDGDPSRVVVVGGGHAGGLAALTLRDKGYTGRITVVGDESWPPYQRPPLSKTWLKSDPDHNALMLRPRETYQERGIELVTGMRAVALRRARREVELHDGSALSYDHLILATGARPRRLDLIGSDLKGVHELRTLDDAERLRAALKPGQRLAVIGGGYVGLEVAASARSLGCEVTVIERETRLLARVASPVLSRFFHAAHSAEGVAIRCGEQVVRIAAAGDVATGVVLGSEEVLAADAVLIGVGATPNDDLAREADLEVRNGIVVDSRARTSDPAIFAIGDVAWRPVPIHGVNLRLESIPNAAEGAKQAAAAILELAAPSPEVPWFWSDQYRHKLQIAGLQLGTDQSVVRGDVGSGRFAVFHLMGRQVVCVEAVSMPAEFMAGRALIGSGTPAEASALADTSIPMKSLLA